MRSGSGVKAGVLLLLLPMTCFAGVCFEIRLSFFLFFLGSWGDDGEIGGRCVFESCSDDDYDGGKQWDGFFLFTMALVTCRFPPPELKRRGGGRGNAPGREGLSTQIDWFVPNFSLLDHTYM